MYSRAAFRRNQATNLVLELQASFADERRLDLGCDREVGRVARYAGAVRDWIVARVPAASRVLALIAGIFDGIDGYKATDALRDRENDRQRALAFQLAGLLDGVDAPLIEVAS